MRIPERAVPARIPTQFGFASIYGCELDSRWATIFRALA